MNENQIVLQGRVTGDPTKSSDCEIIFPIAVKRISGTEDVIMVHAKELTLPKDKELKKDDVVKVCGKLTTTNFYSADGKRHLMIYAFAHIIQVSPEQFSDLNIVDLVGHVCNKPIKRVTPFGKDITELTIAVKHGNKSAYIPCITWKKTAVWAKDNINIGDEVEVEGRLQSREYVKVHENGECEENTAYELSIFKICKTGYNNKRSNS